MSDYPELRGFLFPPDYSTAGVELQIIDSSGQVALSAPGSASCRVPNDTIDASALNRHLIRWDALTNPTTGAYETLCTTRIVRPQRVTVTEREGVDEVTTLQGPGILDDPSKSVVGAPLEPGVTPVGLEMRFDWTSPLLDRSAWPSVVDRALVSDGTVPPLGQWGRPSTWLNCTQRWMAIDAGAAGVDDSLEPWYLYASFTLPYPAKIMLVGSFDDTFVMALDGVVVMDPVADPGDSADETWVRVFDNVPAGTHRVAIKADNVPRLGPGNAAMGLCNVYQEVLTATGWEWDLVLQSGTAGGWKCLHPSEPTPGFTVGRIIRELKARAAALNEPFGDWTLDFTDSVDSDGATWPKHPVRFDAKLDQLAALTQMRDAGLCEFLADKESLTLHAWVAGGAGWARTTSVVVPSETEDAATVSHLEHDVDYAAVVTQLEVIDANGWFRVGTPGLRKSLDLSSIDDREESTRIATTTLARLSSPVESVRLDWDAPTEPLTPRPGQWWVGDTIMGLAIDGTEEAQRVQALSWRFGDYLQWTPELVDIRRTVLDRLASIQQATSPGLLGGRSEAVAPTTPRQPAPQSLERVSHNYSSSGPAADISDTGEYSTGPIKIDRRQKALRLTIGCTELHPTGGSSSGSTTLQCVVNGTVLTSVTLGPSTQFATTNLAAAGTLHPGDVVSLVLSARGQHLNVSGELIAAYLP